MLLYADMIEDYEALAKIGQEKQVDLILAIKDDASFQEASSFFKKVLRIPDVPLGRINQIKMAIIQALSKGLVKKGDKWVCLSGIPQTKALDNLLILEFGKEFEIISSSDLPVISEIVRPEVFETVLEPRIRNFHRRERKEENPLEPSLSWASMKRFLNFRTPW